MFVSNSLLEALCGRVECGVNSNREEEKHIQRKKSVQAKCYKALYDRGKPGKLGHLILLMKRKKRRNVGGVRSPLVSLSYPLAST